VTTYAEDVAYVDPDPEDRQQREPATAENQRRGVAAEWIGLAAFLIPDASPTAVNRPNGPEPTTRAYLGTAIFADVWSGNATSLPSDPFTQPKFRLRQKPLASQWRLHRRVRTTRRLLSSFVRKQEWIGRVERVLEDRFLVSLTDRTLPNEEEVAEIWMEEVSARDRELVKPGAIFYWIIGYQDAADGQRRSQSLLRFRRPLEITGDEREAAWSRARRLREMVGGDADHTPDPII
jgi:hypothetical protein